MALVLNAQLRELTGKKVRTLRKQNLIPAVLYGKEIAPQNLVVEYLPFQKVYSESGESTLIDLKVQEKEPMKVLIHDVQIDPVTKKIIHVDFWKVRMTEKIEAEIVLKFVGEAEAVKGLGGILVKNLDSLKVKCLPQDLVHEIEVDISPLKTFDDVIHVKDLKIPPEIEVLVNPEEIVAVVTPPRSEEELKEIETKPEERIEEIQVEEKRKKEEAEEAGE
jgi:large subunit ribosomal protein L25